MMVMIFMMFSPQERLGITLEHTDGGMLTPWGNSPPESHLELIKN